MCPRSQCHGERAGHISQVEHGPGMHIYGVTVIAHLGNHVQGIEYQVVMTQHHAF